MGKIFLSITMSLDGYSSGREITQKNPMGLSGQLLHQWLFDKKQKGDEEVALETFQNTGAVILGSRTYLTAIHGVWENQSPFPVPALVLSSKKIEPVAGFTIVNEGILRAVSQAKSIAKEKDVLVMGGVNTAQQFLYGDFLDEIHLHIAPILLGSGSRLFENGNKQITEFKKIKVIETPAATHMVLKAAGK